MVGSAKDKKLGVSSRFLTLILKRVVDERHVGVHAARHERRQTIVSGRNGTTNPPKLISSQLMGSTMSISYRLLFNRH
jgi:hypothetical protein